MFDDYESIKPLIRKTDNSSQKVLHWQDFEYFVASIRCLKSRAMNQGVTTIGAMHYGADMNEEDKNFQFTNRSLTLVTASSQVPTPSTEINSTEWLVECSDGTSIDVRGGHHCVINGGSAKAGDHFLSLDVACSEVSQSKDYVDSTTLNQLSFNNERKKAASKDDFFILYTTKSKCNIELGPGSAIVHGDNWRNYFGPFAGRAYLYAKKRKLDVDTASIGELQLTGMSSKDANTLKRRVSDGDDLNTVLEDLQADGMTYKMLGEKKRRIDGV